MKKNFARKLFSVLFLFIFFVKMVISIAPLIADHMDSRFISSVIMQLEIESHSTKGAEAKDSVEKAEWLSGISKFNFGRPHVIVAMNRYILMRDNPIQAFFPSVPTPPPNC